MTPDQLRHLADVFKASPREADAFIDSIIGSRPGSGVYVKGKGARRYLVERPGPEIGESTADRDRLEHLGDLMRLAGFGAELRKLRKACETRTPVDPRQHVPSEPWVATAERVDPNAEPDVQALACMRLQVHTVFLTSKPWIQVLAARRLSQLLVEFPALMHPRLAFEWNRRVEGPDREPTEPHSMAMFFAKCSNALACMPITAHDISSKQLVDFAAHPVVAAGIRAKAPTIPGVHAAGGSAQGFTMMGYITQTGISRPGLAASMLQLDRLRQKHTKGASLFIGRDGDSSGFLRLLGDSLRRLWIKPDADASRLYREILVSEVRRSPTFPPNALNLRPVLWPVLWHAPGIFHDKVGASIQRSTDPEARFERLKSLLVEIGGVPDESAATIEIMKAVFPKPGDALPFSTAVDQATVSTANRMIGSWLCAGVDLEDLRTRLARCQSSEESPWVQALQPYVHEKVMRDTIDAAGAGHAADSADSADPTADPVSTSRPRRSRVL
ncbi:hypothetical protein [Paucibacter soli]|uniref:hypothetical protein n=1 Tax=Paucibacter soli TaxID=3133433 RepID=UPI00309D4191